MNGNVVFLVVIKFVRKFCIFFSRRFSDVDVKIGNLNFWIIRLSVYD